MSLCVGSYELYIVPEKTKTKRTKQNQLDSNVSKKADIIESKGTIYKERGNGYFNVELDDPEGHHVCAVHQENLSLARFNCL